MSSYYRTISDCLVTQSTSNVVRPYVSDTKDPWYKTCEGYNSGIDIECDDVYTVCPCVVTYIGRDYYSKMYDVVIQYSADISFRYNNLKNVEVSAGDILWSAVKLGSADKTCRFEYLSSSQDDSKWPVRIGAKQYYKQDPEEYADGTIVLRTMGIVSEEDIDESAILGDTIPQSTLDFYGDGY